MNGFAHLALISWVPVGLLAFAVMRPRRAVFAIAIGGSMFLPILRISVAGLPDYTKEAAISYALLLGMLCFDAGSLRKFVPTRADLPLVVWLLAGSIASLSNGYGVYDAASQFLIRSLTWGVPYFVGKAYLSSAEGLKDALRAVFVGGLIYVPLALYEVRMSPQLHRLLYGEMQHSFLQTVRAGGFRPMVFMHHGLELSLWMASATVAGYALWKTLRVRNLAGIPSGALVLTLAATLLLCKSAGAMALFAAAMLVMCLPRLDLLRIALLAVIPSYIILRLFGQGEIENAVLEIAAHVSPDRAHSFQYRLSNEDLLLQKFWQKPLFGVGAWDFRAVEDLDGASTTDAVPDSQWIIAVTTNGVLGLASLIMSLWIPAARGMLAGLRSPTNFAVGLILTMLLLDELVNAHVLPIYVAMAGGLTHTAATSNKHFAASVKPRKARPLRPRGALSNDRLP